MELEDFVGVFIIVVALFILGYTVMSVSREADRRFTSAYEINERHPQYDVYYNIITKDDKVTKAELDSYKYMVIFGRR